MVADRGREDQKCVEPSTRLIKALRNEIRRESILEALLVLERIVDLGKGHRTTLEPTVENFGNANHLALARRAGPRDRIDELLVEIVEHDS